jgi:indoleamine 2,3-dioxygenase
VTETGWRVMDAISEDRGFLVDPDPAPTLAAWADLLPAETYTVEAAALELPALLKTDHVRAAIEALPLIHFPFHARHRPLLLERLMQLYTFLASAYVHAPDMPEAHRLPASVAVPLVQLADWKQRPPMLAYADYVLRNWQRIDPAGEIGLANTTTVQNFIGGADESWFIRTHVEIEAQAAGALKGLWSAAQQTDDLDALEAGLGQIPASIDRMIASFHRMPEGCDPDVYYQRVRRYNMGFKAVVYEGVDKFGGLPQTYRGGSGAQSSVIPALVAGLGIQHETSGLTHHLDAMQAYMPKPHRDFIAHMKTARIRQQVINAERPPLTDVYNECLRKVLAFRTEHLRYADLYIAQRGSAVGTGGTLFMDWLAQMTRETERQLL